MSVANYINVTLDKNASDASFATNPPSSFNYSTNYSTLNNSYKPTRSGYTFDKWYLDKACKTAATGDLLKYTHTLYAGWKNAEYSVRFDGNGGTINGSATATVNGEKYAIRTPCPRIPCAADTPLPVGIPIRSTETAQG